MSNQRKPKLKLKIVDDSQSQPMKPLDVKHSVKYKKQLGQYFTISNELQQFVFDKVKHKSKCLLEPSFGAGHLLKKFKEHADNYQMVCCELDNTIQPVIEFNEHQTIIYGDFMVQQFDKKFKTIIGNPPYIKQKTGNLYIKFIEKSYDHLDDDGELIFIVPSDFIKLTSASSIIEKMTQTGSFTDFLYPNNERLFEDASVDVIVFRYEKGVAGKHTVVNGKEMLCNVNKGIITFSDTEVIGTAIESLFNVYVGIVSGRDEIYRVPFGNIDVLSDEEKLEQYIFTETFPSGIQEIDDHLQLHKNELLERKIKKFTEKNWFEWGAPRNITSIKKYWGNQCIYVKTLTRKKIVSFISTVQYFGGSLICLVPKTQMNCTEIQRIVDYLNSTTFQKNYVYSERFKIGHKQICKEIVPN
uniref:site-specific DNA-methyltransferase (adenine-specific) n=1 Tax=viral metagenome TaxID=1070528 RepID=A0A6C0BX75_9ZZZZ